MSNGSGGNNCEETIYHDGNYTSVKAEGDRRTFIQTIDKATYGARLAVAKERITQGLKSGWTPAELALSTEIMYGHTPEEVNAFDPETHKSLSGLSRSEQYSHAFTIIEGLVDVGAIPNHDSVISQESMDHLPGHVNPLLSQYVEYREPVAV